MQLVHDRAPDGFERLSDVVSDQELAEIADRYKAIAGFAVAKRIQSPPILSISRRPFGNDLREGEVGYGFQFTHQPSGSNRRSSRRAEERGGECPLHRLQGGWSDSLPTRGGELAGLAGQPLSERTPLPAQVRQRFRIKVRLGLPQFFGQSQRLPEALGTLLSEHVDHPRGDRRFS